MLYVLVPGVFDPWIENDVNADADDAKARLAPIAQRTVATLRVSIFRIVLPRFFRFLAHSIGAGEVADFPAS
jgi:hypothetical protein